MEQKNTLQLQNSLCSDVVFLVAVCMGRTITGASALHIADTSLRLTDFQSRLRFYPVYIAIVQWDG